MLHYINQKLSLLVLDGTQKNLKLLNRYLINYVQSLRRLLDISLSKYLHLPKYWHRHAKYFEHVLIWTVRRFCHAKHFQSGMLAKKPRGHISMDVLQYTLKVFCMQKSAQNLDVGI